MNTQINRALIEQVLAEATTTRQVVIQAGAIADVSQLVEAAYPQGSALIVADERTFDVAGRDVVASLRASGRAVENPIVFPSDPALRPDYQHVERLRTAFTPAVVPIAVGSGTINDLTKRAAFEANLPYVVVATAASMDGYTASGAALVHEGVKQTFSCPAPEIVIADLDILRAAPREMTGSGYGDLVGKVTAGADWIVADALGIEPIKPDVWEMVQEPLRGMIADPGRFPRGDEEAIEQLFLGLVTTGLAIQVAGSTRPASGSEHQFSHLWEMRSLEHHGELVSHGMKVGLGTMVSTALYERLLDRPLEQLDVDGAVASWPELIVVEADIRKRYDHPRLVEKALEECRAKYISRDDLRGRLNRVRDQWFELRTRLREQLLPILELQDLLRQAGCPTQPEDIGLTREQFRESHLSAGQIRRRYTVFDLASETGLLDACVDELFAPQGFWSATSK